MEKYHGFFPALISPFNEKGELMTKNLEDILDFLIDVQKVDGLYVTGSTGEFLLMSVEERQKVYEIVAKKAKNKVTLIAQIGSLNLEEAIQLGKKAKELGFDAISAITPFYYNFSFDEIKNYYEEIAKNVDLPMFIYYLPQLAGSKINIEQFGSILNLKNVIGCKFGSNDIFLFERLIKTYPEKIWMYAFDEAFGLAYLLGARGFIGSTYNTNAIKARKILDLAKKGDLLAFKNEIHVYNDYIQSLLEVGLMQTIKAIMQLYGVDAGYNRLPFKKICQKTLNQKALEIKEKFLD
ncbi:N-acetylneuraminate lyase [Mesomycoplasma ovipneumoniae]|uniref:N-acetylneuraminate lyase n=1 Tax=Mesomycoplasma ovipneumoniae TaxID=29562 RepID=A0AAJ2P7J9_9BACT|nr:N-acetylneuraminate lyase [Mesomycoplasma ovipneumoniae]MDW2906429.1 N-acetylneuraminate lyase [Mesomycoplasma ovipneumoniae]MDW2914346.1 N-acetylneuraminate lyase [Mesomycoplasma ovipneumoniae]